MVFVESPWFCAWRETYLDDSALNALQGRLQVDPSAGPLIPGASGLRKLRVALPGRGKRGGARVIYYHWVSAGRIYLLYAYAKNVQADLTKDQLKRLVAVMKEEQIDG